MIAAEPAAERVGDVRGRGRSIGQPISARAHRSRRAARPRRRRSGSPPPPGREARSRRPRRGRRGRPRRHRQGTGRPSAKARRGPMSTPGAERRVHLVAAEGDEVGLAREAAGAARAARRRRPRGRRGRGRRSIIASIGGSQPVMFDAPVIASSRGAGDASSARSTSLVVEGPVGPALDEAARGDPRPGQQVGVVLDHRRDHDVVRDRTEAVGELVDRLGRVAAEDRATSSRPRSAREAEDGGAGRLVGARRELGLVPRTAVHARVLGRNSVTRSSTAGNAAVEAAASRER